MKQELEQQGYSDDSIQRLQDSKPDLVIAAAKELPSPSGMKTGGARSRMKRITENAGIEVQDGSDYLEPHGGRRGMGEVMVRQEGYSAAARFLDNSEEMVRRAYQHIEAAEQAQQATAALAETDQLISDSNDGTPTLPSEDTPD